MKKQEPVESVKDPGSRMLAVLLLTAAAGFLLLHYLHLRADFPNHSPWIDWAKYTDEGWYGDAAIRHYLRGAWRLPGDFNPAAALPVWPLVEAALFRFTGVGIVAARALTVSVLAACMVCGFFLLTLRAELKRDLSMRRVFAAGAVLLLSTSPFVYVFTRMAILEPLLVLLLMLSLLAAYGVRRSRTRTQWIGNCIAVGVLIALMIGTKTTAIFLLPAVLYMLLSSAGWRLRRMLRVTAVTGVTVGGLWSCYFAVLVHRGYLADFRYLFTANQYTGITRATFLKVIATTFADGVWIGTPVYWLAGAVLMFSLLRPRIWRDAVFVSLVLWAAGYMVFLAYHANLQPRYYLVVAFPVILLVVRGGLHMVEWQPPTRFVLAPLLLAIVVQQAYTTAGYVLHPDYSFNTAANQVEQVVQSEPNHSHTVLSVSGSNLSLMTGLPSICDDFGTMQLEDRIAAYRPGWFVAWNYVEDDKMDALGKFYRLTRVAQFPAMDDPDRNVMIVYRLDLKTGAAPQRKHKGSRLLPTGT